MNKIGYIFLWSALVATCGCSKGMSEVDSDVIQLTTSVNSSFGVKAPLTEASEFTAHVCGWEPSAVVDYTAAPGWNSTAVIPAGASGSTITLDPKQNYHKDNTTYIKAWHPVTISPVNGSISFTSSDGSLDVLYTKEAVSGSRNQYVSAPLVFSHLLTQIKFELKDGGSWDPSEKIKKITIKNVTLPASLHVGTGVLTPTSAADLSVPGISQEGITVIATAVAAGDPVMILPLNSNTFQIDVETTAKTFTGVEIKTDDATFLEGRAYTATITLTKTGVIGMTATITPWTNGTSGGSIVD